MPRATAEPFTCRNGPDSLQIHIYLLLINRLYLDALSARLRGLVPHAIDRLNRLGLFSYAAASIAVVSAALAAGQLPQLAAPQIVSSRHVRLAAAVSSAWSLRRRITSFGICRRGLAAFAAVGGLVRAGEFVGRPSRGFLRAVGVLALLACSTARLKRCPDACARALRLMPASHFTPLFGGTSHSRESCVAVASLYPRRRAAHRRPVLAWQFFRRRYGILSFDRMHGLARPMPRFAALFSSSSSWPSVRLPPFALVFRPCGNVASAVDSHFLGTRGCLARLVSRFLVSLQNDATAALRAAMPRPALRRFSRRRIDLLCRPARHSSDPRGHAADHVGIESVSGLPSNRPGDDFVAPLTVSPYSETQRMELRTLIRLASEIIADYWPMRTFVHHNPLHGLENLSFERA